PGGAGAARPSPSLGPDPSCPGSWAGAGPRVCSDADIVKRVLPGPGSGEVAAAAGTSTRPVAVVATAAVTGRRRGSRGASTRRAAIIVVPVREAGPVTRAAVASVQITAR